MLAAWLASWGLLYAALRRRHADPRPWFAVGLLLLLLGVLGVWLPAWHALGG